MFTVLLKSCRLPSVRAKSNDAVGPALAPKFPGDRKSDRIVRRCVGKVALASDSPVAHERRPVIELA